MSRISLYVKWDTAEEVKLINDSCPPLEPEGEPITFSDKVFCKILSVPDRYEGISIGNIMDSLSECIFPQDKSMSLIENMQVLYYRSILPQVLEGLIIAKYIRIKSKGEFPIEYRPVAADCTFYSEARYGMDDDGHKKLIKVEFPRHSHLSKWPSQINGVPHNHD